MHFQDTQDISRLALTLKRLNGPCSGCSSWGERRWRWWTSSFDQLLGGRGIFCRWNYSNNFHRNLSKLKTQQGTHEIMWNNIYDGVEAQDVLQCHIFDLCHHSNWGAGVPAKAQPAPVKAHRWISVWTATLKWSKWSLGHPYKIDMNHIINVINYPSFWLMGKLTSILRIL